MKNPIVIALFVWIVVIPVAVVSIASAYQAYASRRRSRLAGRLGQGTDLDRLTGSFEEGWSGGPRRVQPARDAARPLGGQVHLEELPRAGRRLRARRPI